MKYCSAALGAMLCALAGCAEPAAVGQLLRAADGALVVAADADAHLKEAAFAQLDQQACTLDAAFVADMKELADDSGRIALEDVLAGKQLYDSRRLAIQQSRQDLQEALDKKDRSLQAARTLIQYAEDLVLRNRAVWYDVNQYIEYVLKSRAFGEPPNRKGTE